MIAASDPVVETAWKFFRGRLANALVGCVHWPGDSVRRRHQRVEDSDCPVGERPDLDLCRARAGDVAAGPDHGDHRRRRRARGSRPGSRDAARRRARRRRAARLPGGVHRLVGHVPALAGDERRRGRPMQNDDALLDPCPPTLRPGACCTQRRHRTASDPFLRKVIASGKPSVLPFWRGLRARLTTAGCHVDGMSCPTLHGATPRHVILHHQTRSHQRGRRRRRDAWAMAEIRCSSRKSAGPRIRRSSIRSLCGIAVLVERDQPIDGDQEALSRSDRSGERARSRPSSSRRTYRGCRSTPRLHIESEQREQRRIGFGRNQREANAACSSDLTGVVAVGHQPPEVVQFVLSDRSAGWFAAQIRRRASATCESARPPPRCPDGTRASSTARHAVGDPLDRRRHHRGMVGGGAQQGAVRSPDVGCNSSASISSSMSRGDRPPAIPADAIRSTRHEKEPGSVAAQQVIEPGAVAQERRRRAPRAPSARGARPRPAGTPDARCCCRRAHVRRLTASSLFTEMRQPPARQIPVDQKDEPRSDVGQEGLERVRAPGVTHRQLCSTAPWPLGASQRSSYGRMRSRKNRRCGPWRSV